MGKLAKMTKDTITLTRSEIGYLLTLVYKSMNDGSYYEQNSVLKKLEKSYCKVNSIVENN